MAHQKADGAGRLLGEVVVELGLATEKQLLEALTKSLGLPAVDLRGIEPSPDALAMLPAKQAREQHILPLRIVERSGRKRLIVALADPTTVPAIDELQFSSGMVVEVKITTAGPLMTAIERHYGTETSPPRKVVTLDANTAKPPPPTLARAPGRPAPSSPAPGPRPAPPAPSRSVRLPRPKPPEPDAGPAPPAPSRSVRLPRPKPPEPDAEPTDPPERSAEAGGEPALKVRKGAQVGLVVRVPVGASLVFGRSGADVVLKDEKMSRRHFTVSHTEDGLVLEDLGSSNGTRVNGTKVEQTGLDPGDEIIAGVTAFEVQLLPPEPAEEEDVDDSSVTTQKVDAREFQRQAEAREKQRR